MTRKTEQRNSKTLEMPAHKASLAVIASSGFEDYRLLDSGAGRKLERFGRVVVDRPEPQAMWQPARARDVWHKADAIFDGDDDAENGKWRRNGPVPESWSIRLKDVTLMCRLTGFRHLGIFPEQLPHWEWMLEGLGRMHVERPRVLNLFAYTGAATMLAAHAGADVTHVDASKRAIAWGKENQQASSLEHAPIRWLLDDARKFVQREVRRGKAYNMILVDPPKFGRGPNNEVWDLFEHLPQLMRDCAALLDKSEAHLILTAYAIRASALAIDQVVREALAARGGTFSSGELVIREERGARALPTSLFTLWSSHDRAS